MKFISPKVDYAFQRIFLVMGQINKGFGEVRGEISSQVEGLFLKDLQRLTEDLFDFNSLEDLSNLLANVNSKNS